MKDTSIEAIEQQLSTARSELREAQTRHAEAVQREQELATLRTPLLRDAKIAGDPKAQDALDRLTTLRLGVRQEVEDFRATADQIQTHITGLEQEYERAIQEQKVEHLRALQNHRGRIATEIEGKTKALAGEITAYAKVANEIVTLGYDLQLGNLSTRSMLGTPLIKDYIARSLSSIFPGGSSTTGKVSLIEMERQAAEALEYELRGIANRKAA